MDKHIFIELAKDIYKLTLLFPKREPLRVKLREIADNIIEELTIRRNDYLDSAGRYLELVDAYLEIAVQQNWVSVSAIAEIKEKYQQAGKNLKIGAPKISAGNIENELVEIKEPSLPMVCQEPPVAPKVIVVPAPARSEQIMPETAQEDKGAASVEKNNKEKDEKIEKNESESQTPFLTAGQIERQNRIMEFLKEKGSAQVWEIQKIFPKVSKRTIRRDFNSMLSQGLIERTGERNTTAYKLKVNLS